MDHTNQYSKYTAMLDQFDKELDDIYHDYALRHNLSDAAPHEGFLLLAYGTAVCVRILLSEIPEAGSSAFPPFPQTIDSPRR